MKLRRLARTLKVSVPVITQDPLPPRILSACRYMGSCNTVSMQLSVEVGLRVETEMCRLDNVYRPDSVTSEFAIRYVVVDTKRRRRIKLRAVLTKEWVYLCLGHSKTM